MACYPLAFLITSPIIGTYMERIGRKNCVVFGMLLMTIATGTFGLAAYVGKTAGVFFAVSILARTMQGVADGMITVTMPAMIVMEYP
jgi:MFS family permease